MAITVTSDAGLVAFDDDEPVGFAQVEPAANDAPDRWSVTLLHDRSAGNSRAVVTELLRAARGQVAQHGGGTLVLWRHRPDEAEDGAALDAGFHPARELYQMRVPLPIAESPQWPAGVRLRTFAPGRDEAAWLAVNNRAFEGHAEQGAWTETTLRDRLAEPWVDLSLFFVAEDGGGEIVGFNWCKVHPPSDEDPALGEIYVIGVDPLARAKGIKAGRPLALAGLDAMAQRGITTGMLYCAADNEPALRLYRSLGFDVYRVDRAYECSVPT
jgi:mycothiol synthase